MPKTLQWIEPTEKEIENAILEYLSYQSGVFAFKVNTMGVYDQRGGFYRKLSKYVKPGTPDIICIVEVLGFPVFVGMECKSTTGRQSKEQKAFQQDLENRVNGFYFVVRTLKDAEAALHLVRETISARVMA